MSDYDMGPQWAWKAIFYLAIFGAIMVMLGACAGIVWLFCHVRFV